MSEATAARALAIRKMSGLSQRKFAKKYGISYRTIQEWENDRNIPKDWILNLLERAVREDFPN